jgi:hypothetical protein
LIRRNGKAAADNRNIGVSQGRFGLGDAFIEPLKANRPLASAPDSVRILELGYYTRVILRVAAI